MGRKIRTYVWLKKSACLTGDHKGRPLGRHKALPLPRIIEMIQLYLEKGLGSWSILCKER